MTKCAVLFLVVVSGFSRILFAQAADGEALYKANCASCHDRPEGRTPSRDALKDRTPDAVLAAMTSGSMTMQAINISATDRRTLAEYVTGKAFGSAAPKSAGLCETKAS